MVTTVLVQTTGHRKEHPTLTTHDKAQRLLDLTIAEFKTRKEEAFRAAANVPGDDDLHPSVAFFRDTGEDIIPLAALDVAGGRDEALQAAIIGIGGYGADVVMLINDAHIVHNASPDLMAKWRPGILQDMCHEQEACLDAVEAAPDDERISDCLVLHFMHRPPPGETEGAWSMSNVEYTLFPPTYEGDIAPDAPTSLGGWRLVWGNVTHLSSDHDNEQLAGRIPDTLRASFLSNPIVSLSHVSGLDPDQAMRAAQQLTTLTLSGYGMLLASKDLANDLDNDAIIKLMLDAMENQD